MSRRRYRPGDQITAAGDIEDRVGAILHRPTLTVRSADRLGCGCIRVSCDRPGPGGYCPIVDLLTGCGRHPCAIAGGA